MICQGRGDQGISQYQLVSGLQFWQDEFNTAHGAPIARQLGDDIVQVSLTAVFGDNGLFVVGRWDWLPRCFHEMQYSSFVRVASAPGKRKRRDQTRRITDPCTIEPLLSR